MARDLTSGMVTEVTADMLSPILLVNLEFDSGDLRLWSGIGDLTFDGEVYSGAGDLLSLSPIEETGSLVATGLVGTLSGIPSSIIATALDEPFMGRPVTVWLGALDGSGSLVSDPPALFKGLIDTMEMEDAGDTAAISVRAENRLVRLERPNVSRYTPDAQAVAYPGDRGFDFVAALNDGREIVWTTTDAG